MDKKGTIGVGMPSMLLMPAGNYYFKIIEDRCEIIIPRKGIYADLVDEAARASFEAEGSFNLYDDVNKVLYLANITKVLFATRLYPDLTEKQAFVPVFLLFEEKDDAVVIGGQVIEVLTEEEYNKEKEYLDGRG